jgi:uncharacterized membrane protein YfcA
MSISGPRVPLLRLVAVTVIGIVAGALLARVSDSLWWQVLPWILLAGFWIFLLRRRHRRPELTRR